MLWKYQKNVFLSSKVDLRRITRSQNVGFGGTITVLGMVTVGDTVTVLGVHPASVACARRAGPLDTINQSSLERIAP
jgi:hypothetical protein